MLLEKGSEGQVSPSRAGFGSCISRTSSQREAEQELRRGGAFRKAGLRFRPSCSQVQLVCGLLPNTVTSASPQTHKPPLSCQLQHRTLDPGPVPAHLETPQASTGRVSRPPPRAQDAGASRFQGERGEGPGSAGAQRGSNIATFKVENVPLS